MPSQNLVETDILVIGGGVAGCFASIKAREKGLTVTIVDKASVGKSGASIAAQRAWMVFNPDWGLDFNVCMDAMVIRGEYINDRDWCKVVFDDSWEVYRDLLSWGVDFPPEATKFVEKFVNELPPFGTIRLRHRKHAPALRKQAETAGVKIMDRIVITDLLKQEGRVVGALGFPTDSYDLYIFKAKATILSAGSNSFKPAGWEIHCLTGDAEAMAYRAGAEITGKEFPSPHFTWGTYPSWRFYRGGRSASCYYSGSEGTRTYWSKTYQGSELAHEPDLTMDFVVHAGKGPVFFDLDNLTSKEIEEMQRRQLDAYTAIDHERIGFDVSRRGKIPLVGGAAAGYANVQAAGVWVRNTWCSTTLPGLYAAGDCCGTRLVGAYHPAPGFGLAGAAVTGRRAGAGAAEYAMHSEKPKIDEEELARLEKIVFEPAERQGGFSPRWVTQVLQNTMVPYFILHVKHGERLRAALTIVEFLRDHLIPKLIARDPHELRLAHETENMVLNAEMILRSSIFRTESRGTHYREDYPRRDDPAWLAWIKLREKQGRMTLSKEPIPKEWWPDLSKPYEERYPRRFPGE